MPPRTKSMGERNQLRMLIIDAARELFVNHGVENVTMRAIAKKIGYSATSIYLHFEDRDSLLREICDTDFLKLASELKSILEIPNPLERMMALGEGYARFALAFPNHYRLMFMSPRPQYDPQLSSIQQNNPEQDAYFQLKMVVSDVFNANLFRQEYQDPELIAQTIWAGIHGVCSLEITMSEDSWVNWCDISLRIKTMQKVLIQGLLKE